MGFDSWSAARDRGLHLPYAPLVVQRMVTICSCPRGFVGDVRIRQENAIESWMQLRPRPEILLIGEEDGVAAIARAWGLGHVPNVERNRYGTPLLRSVVEAAQQAATQPILCYVNADIVLLHDWLDAVLQVVRAWPDRPFLAVGGRWNLPSLPQVNFDDPEWEIGLHEDLDRRGWLDTAIAMDYFVFPRTIAWRIPPLALGRQYWDSWFVYEARRQRVPVVDLSSVATAVHVEHGYDHIRGRSPVRMSSPEIEENRRWVGWLRRRTIGDATFVLLSTGLRRRQPWETGAAWWLRLEHALVYYLRDHGGAALFRVYNALRGAKQVIGRVVRMFPPAGGGR